MSDVLPIAISVTVACTMLLAAVGAHLWNGFRQRPGLSVFATVAAWAAAGVLLLGALLVWGGRLPVLEPFLYLFDMGAWQGPVLPMVLMAALAIPLGGDADLRIKPEQESSWSRALAYLPALVLTVAVLIRVSAPSEAALSGDWVTPIRFAIAVCAGLGARAMGQALRVIVEGSGPVDRFRALSYAFLTLISGSAALVNLWQRGMVWGSGAPVMRGGLAGAWLVWSADWLAPRRHPRLRAALTVMAALLLIVVAVSEA
jgi:hypothetical protein